MIRLFVLLILCQAIISCGFQPKSTFSSTKVDFPADASLFSALDVERFNKAFSNLNEKVEGANQGFSIDSLELENSLFPETKSAISVARYKISRLNPVASKVSFDMGEQLVLKSVSVDGVFLNQVDRQKESLTVPLDLSKGPEFKIEIYYSVTKPEGGLYFVKDPKSGAEQAWTMAEPEDARQWFPCIDDPTAKILNLKQIVSVPGTWKVLANGDLTHTDKSTGKRATYVWEHKFPIATYLVNLVAGELEVINADSKITPVSYWVPKEDIDAAQKGFKQTPEMIEFYSKNLIPYPFEKYAIGVNYGGEGAMEHTTSTTFSHNLQNPVDGLDDSVSAHELSHHWFGDIVTCKTWNDLWLNEGFASLFDVLFFENSEGKEKRMERLYHYQARYWGEESVRGNGSLGPIYNPETPAENKFNVLNYEKAALVIHTLKSELGDNEFYRGLKNYLEKYKFSNATTVDFKQVYEELLGINLNAFFNQWIYGKGMPEFFYTWKWNTEQKYVEVNIKQTQKVGRFSLNIPFEVGFIENGKVFTQTVKLQVGPGDASVVLKYDQAPVFLAINPYHDVLMKSSSEKSVEEWNNILNNSSSYLTKVDAIDGLGANIESKQIENVLTGGAHNLLKGAAIGSLKFKGEAEALRLAKGFLKDSDDTLRTEAIKLFGKLKTKLVVDELIEIFKVDLNWRVAMVAAQSLGEIGDAKAVPVLISEFERAPKRGYLIAYVLDALGRLGDKSAVQPILKYFVKSEGYERAVFMRIRAVKALGLLKDVSVVDTLGASLLNDKNEGLQREILLALKNISSSTCRHFIEEFIKTNPSDELKSLATEVLKSLP